MRIAITQSDPDEATRVAALLEEAGHICTVCGNLQALIREARHSQNDLVVLDWETSAPAVATLAQLARRASILEQPLPVLCVAPAELDDATLETLLAGGNDVLPRPWRAIELQARVHSLLRRTYPAFMDGQTHFPAYHFDTTTGRVDIDTPRLQCAANLTRREFELALLLFRNLNRALSRDYLRVALWGRTAQLSSRTLDTHVSRVRIKLFLEQTGSYRLLPVYGFGYRLTSHAAPAAATPHAADAPQASGSARRAPLPPRPMQPLPPV